MSEYEDTMLKQLRTTGLVSPDVSDEDLWSRYVAHALPLMSRPQRALAIEWCTEAFDACGTNISRDKAKIMQRLRDVQRVDEELWRSGR